MSSVKLVIEGTWDEILSFVAAAKGQGSLVNLQGQPTLVVDRLHAKEETSTTTNDAATPQREEKVKVRGKVVKVGDVTLPSITFDDIKVIIPQAIAAAGREKLVALLTEFKAKKGSDILPDDYAAFAMKAHTLIDGRKS